MLTAVVTSASVLYGGFMVGMARTTQFLAWLRNGIVQGALGAHAEFRKEGR
jgi:hypothetical protein